MSLAIIALIISSNCSGTILTWASTVPTLPTMRFMSTSARFFGSLMVVNITAQVCSMDV